MISASLYNSLSTLEIEMSDMKIRFVVATRETKDDFFSKTATGRTLNLYKKWPFVELDLYDSNRIGLPVLYNRSIETAKDNPAILIFAHDDIHLTDFFWADQVVNSLKHFDIVGVAGNRRRLAYQPSWAFINDQLQWDQREYLSGVVGHGKQFPPPNLSVYGKTCQKVQLLDGVFLVCQSQFMHDKNLMFDERFNFHFYDLDFCRQAEQVGARLGTWSISLIHESGGAFNSPQWKLARDEYFLKWGD